MSETRAALYLRVSTSAQTTENQKSECLAAALARGWSVVAIYEETRSAARRRAVFEQLLSDACAKRFDAVIVWRVDRLGRNMRGNINDVLDLGRLGVSVMSVKEPWLDSAGPARNLLLAIFSWVAEEERRVLIERTRAGIERARREGGTRWPKREERKVRAAAKLVREGADLTTAAREKGVPAEWLREHLLQSAEHDIASGVSLRRAARENKVSIRSLRARRAAQDGAVPRGILPFGEAREVARSLGLRTVTEWRQWCASDDYRLEIPVLPHEVYRDEGWTSWSDWLNGLPTRRFLPFIEAREVARSLGLSSVEAWWAWCKVRRPAGIPSDPRRSYAEFSGWPDWLGYERRRLERSEMLHFVAARRAARALGFCCSAEWTRWASSPERPANIPYDPQAIYADRWSGWVDWLGSSPKEKLLPFRKARARVRRLGLRACREWRRWKQEHPKLSRGLPMRPERTYALEWRGWGDFLGKKMLPFRQARAYVVRLGLRSTREWKRWARSGKRPRVIPASPMVTYQDEWRGMPHWLGYASLRMMPFRKARQEVRALHLRSQLQWTEWAKSDKRPPTIPSNPWKVYQREWRGLRDWLSADGEPQRLPGHSSASITRALDTQR